MLFGICFIHICNNNNVEMSGQGIPNVPYNDSGNLYEKLYTYDERYKSNSNMSRIEEEYL